MMTLESKGSDSSNHWKTRKIRKTFFMVLFIIPYAIFIFMHEYFHAILKYNYHSKNIMMDNHKSDVFCHYLKTIDFYPVVDNSFDPPEKSIFFHETTCLGTLNERQACAVEAAASSHPNWQIYVLFSATSFDIFNPIMKKLRQFPNVKFYRVYIEDYAKDTPLEGIVKSGVLKTSKYKVAHTADVLRFITLYKWSGLYLDLDVIMTRSVESLAKNFVGRESDNFVSSSVLAFANDVIGRNMAESCALEMSLNFTTKDWGISPAVITRVLKNICDNGTDVRNMSSASCLGFEVYPQSYFNPIKWKRAPEYFTPRKNKWNFSEVYGYHLFNKETWNIYIERGSLYEEITQKYCPVIANFTGTLNTNQSY